MISPPDYFHPIREKAVQRWNQLENDKELAGPWIQLFQQVQSPRHGVSELLQNADDAGASEASVKITDGYFVFEHNGEDFTEDHFASLCKFGYSNKRFLHTIGFRGIGFKSVFSLGETIELFSPTLSIKYHRDRFTQPEWIEPIGSDDNLTSVRVKIEDNHREKELRKNLHEWIGNPYSLLFFKCIRRINFESEIVHWIEDSPGPVKNSVWMQQDRNPDEKILHIKSDPLTFPKEAIDEIRKERTGSSESDLQLPKCEIDLLLGAKGKLYVVLPTQVRTDLPFAINAPFIQDPARLKIKDPETSATNRWLLSEAGKLAAETMIHWLNNNELKLRNRSDAYDILTDIDKEDDDDSIETSCGELVEKEFITIANDHPIVLADDGLVVEVNEAIVLPKAIHRG